MADLNSDNQNTLPSQNLTQAQPNGSLSYQQPAAKEQKEAFVIPIEGSKEVIIEYKEPEPAKEVAEWVEKVPEKEEIKLPEPIYDQSGQVILDNATPQKPQITLPLDDQGVKSGLKQKVQDSLRWLAEWCLRIIKMDRWKIAS